MRDSWLGRVYAFVKKKRREGVAVLHWSAKVLSLSKSWTGERGARAVGVVLVLYCWRGKGTRAKRRDSERGGAWRSAKGAKGARGVRFLSSRGEASSL